MDTADSTTVPPTRQSDSSRTARPMPVPAAAGAVSSSTPGAPSDVAKEQAGRVAKETAATGAALAGTAKEQAGKVAAETKTQVKDLLAQAQEGLREQAGSQQKRVAGGLHSLGEELSNMARNSDGQGVATDLVQQLSTRADGIAAWLDNRDPGSLLGEVRRYARQHPGTFIAVAAAAGLLAGRLTRSVTAATADDHADRPTRPAGAHLETADQRTSTPATPTSLPAATQVSDVGESSYTIQPHPNDLGATADPYRSNESDPYRRSGDLGAADQNRNGRMQGENQR